MKPRQLGFVHFHEIVKCFCELTNEGFVAAHLGKG
jgi:hypothetical protein